MDVVLRTPNGEAEVSIGAGQEDLAVGELVRQVTGRPANQIVYIDARAVPASTSLGTSGLLNGSTISTTDDAVTPPADGRVELVQVAGQGAGARRWLTPGRYRIGVGRRVSAAELDHAPVDTPMLELDVSAVGAVVVRATTVPARLDGVALDRDEPTPWTTGLVDVAGRVFELGCRDPRSMSTGGHRFAGVGIDGTAAFNRPPRLAAAPQPAPLDVPDETAGGRTRRMGSARGRRGDPGPPFTDLVARRHREERDRRREAHPDLSRAVQLAESAAAELWQRRPGHPDVYQVPIGLADLDWSPALGPRALTSAQSIVGELPPLPLVPVTVDLLAERGVGFVGGSGFTQAITRGFLVEAAVTHGPADLDIVVLTSPDRAGVWEWVKWLPHARSGGGARIYSTDAQVAGWAAALRRGWQPPTRPAAPTHVTIVVADEPTWWRDRTAPLRPLFSDASMPLRFAVLTAESADVPAVCTTVVTEQPDHGARVDFLMDRRRVDGLHAYLASEEVAQRAARRLAPLDDPDVPMATQSALPASAPILSLLGMDDPSPGAVADRWARRTDHGLTFTAGIDARGPLRIDLVADGPHALVAGTARSGKSELLRNLVVGLAAAHPPDEVNFVLVDIAGASTFLPCARLPHVVGMVTGLDEHLASRFVRYLRAELARRDDVLRDAGVSSLADHRQRGNAAPLPRLVIVVDEFASLATEAPEFIPSLVGLAARGRSLGLHMVLATQRPAGVVDDRIRANTDLRIALRLQDDGDSFDVIGTSDAARLPGRVPGRAYARRPGGEPTMFQTAYSAGVTVDATRADLAPADTFDAAPYVVARDLAPMETRLLRRSTGDDPAATSTQSDLDRLVAAIVEAAEQVGQSNQRQPYLDPLAEHIELGEFLAAHPGDDIPYALVDLPDEQRQAPAWWSPGRDGSLLVHGTAGAGTSSLLVTLMLGVAERCSPDDVHLYCIDADAAADAARLAPLDALAHVGAVVGIDEPDRIARLATHLAGLLDHRERLAHEPGSAEAVAASEPAVVLMIDDVGSLRRQLEQRRDLGGVWADLERVIREGSPLGVCTVVTAREQGAMPSSLATQISSQLVMRLGAPAEYSALGFAGADIPEMVPGRALRREDSSEMQLAEPSAALAEAVARLGVEPARERPVRRIEPLPAFVGVDDVVVAARRTEHELIVPVGLDTRTAEPALCIIPFGEAAFIVGAPGTGRSSVLAAFAAACRSVAPDVAVFGVAPRGGPLSTAPGVDFPAESSAVSAWVDRIEATVGPRIVLVDDADRLGGPSFERLAALRDDRLITVVAGRGDELRAASHWSRPLRRFRHGVLLRPGPADGDIVRVSLGPRLPHFDVHRGVLVVDGEQIPLLAAIVTTAPSVQDGS